MYTRMKLKINCQGSFPTSIRVRARKLFLLTSMGICNESLKLSTIFHPDCIMEPTPYELRPLVPLNLELQMSLVDYLISCSSGLVVPFVVVSAA